MSGRLSIEGAARNLMPHARIQSKSRCVRNTFSDDEEANLPGRSRASSDSFNSPDDEARPPHVRGRSFLLKFSDRQEIRHPRDAVPREAYYFMAKKRGGRDFWGVLMALLAP